MAANIWFTSDTHFFHANILKFVGADKNPIRPFKSITEMHEVMIQNWNSVVKPQDHVWHLGDVTFYYGKGFNELMWRLNGKKRMLVGNHDKLRPQNFNALAQHFEKIEYWKGFKGGNFTCTHVPHPLDSLRDGEYNVHGHTHQNCKKDPRYINVCVEVRDYTPVNYDTILSEIRRSTK